MEKQKNIPALRFPEFTEEWERKKVGELCDFIVPGRNKPTSFLGDIPWITTPDIEHNGEINYSKSGLVISKEEAKRVGSKIVPINSIIISCVGELGLVAIAGKEIVINQHLHTFIPKEQINYKFLLYELSNKKKYMDKVATKTAVPYMNKDNCNSIPVIFPSLPEQQKIASFLSAIDEKLQALKKKKSLLEQYKKGVMQKIFSQEIRFKEDNGADFPGWEERQLKDILKEHKKRNLNNEVKEVFSVAKNKGVINQIKHLGRSYASKETTNYKVVFPDDVIYTKSPTSDFPYGIIKQNKLNRTGIVSVLYGVFTPINKFIGFILDYYFSIWENTYNYLNPLVQKGAKNTMNIGNNDFLNGAEISLPTAEKEQIKIANFLLAMDVKISHCQTQIEKTDQYKKGLLQQMFV